jgi:hypothetical protein
LLTKRLKEFSNQQRQKKEEIKEQLEKVIED